MCIITFVIYHDGQKFPDFQSFLSVLSFLPPHPSKKNRADTKNHSDGGYSKVGTFLIPFFDAHAQNKTEHRSGQPRSQGLHYPYPAKKVRLPLVKGTRTLRTRFGRGRPLNLGKSLHIFVSDCTLSDSCACTIFVSMTGVQPGIQHTRRETAKTKTTS